MGQIIRAKSRSKWFIAWLKSNFFVQYQRQSKLSWKKYSKHFDIFRDSFIHLSEWRHIDKPFPFFLCFGESSMIGDSDSPLSTSCISCVPTGDTSLTRFFEAGSCTGNVSSVGLGSFVSLLGS